MASSLQRIIKNLENRPPKHGFFAGIKALKKITGLSYFKLFFLVLSDANPDTAEVLRIKIPTNAGQRVLNKKIELLQSSKNLTVYIKTSFNPNNQWPYFAHICDLFEKYGYNLFNLYDIKRNIVSGRLISADALFVSSGKRNSI